MADEEQINDAQAEETPSGAAEAEAPTSGPDATQTDETLPAQSPDTTTEQATDDAKEADAPGDAPSVLNTGGIAKIAEDASGYEAPTFDETEPQDAAAAIELLDDVELEVQIELGRTEMYIEDVLRLGVGSVVELDKLAGDPVDIYVNGRLIARGEVLVLNDNFCVRINDIHSPIPELESA